ncbi:hypothetical protein [Mangrovivirga cuniculi]|uniref:DUF5689 domain-containing protein n=1 Tax=Mangrovivirga cuniculi TaxID=2715131 RepID=A0A4D7JGB5_9BACT|nr:hypothetical protein [Mangrovivirga cuniculi]QCK15189.1 hypothetical protein DCC35_10740 [Mangrovivirga cuniculi]
MIKLFKFVQLAVLVFCVFVFTSCEEEPISKDEKIRIIHPNSTSDISSRTVSTSEWTSGTISSIVSPDNLVDLGGQLSGEIYGKVTIRKYLEVPDG